MFLRRYTVCEKGTFLIKGIEKGHLKLFCQIGIHRGKRFDFGGDSPPYKTL